MSDQPQLPASSTTRRRFMQQSALFGAGAVIGSELAVARAAYAQGSETLKVGLVGCGGRGTGAARQTLTADGNTQLVAMADAFENELRGSLSTLLKTDVADRINVPPEQMFDGLDAYEKLLATDVDIVLLATPPQFRPVHLRACIDAGKHVFVEKPVAVDAAGVRSVLETTELARQKNLTILSGLCWRYEPSMQETIARLQAGAIGDLTYLQSFRYSGGVEKRQPRVPGETEMQHQLRNWYYYTWLSGDFNVEQFVHEMDKMSWLMGEYPVRCVSTGGRETRIGEDYGNIFDHFATVFEYANGVRYYATTRHQRGCDNEFKDMAFGTNGSCELMRFTIKDRAGETAWRSREDRSDMHQLEHNAMYSALRKGEIINNGEYMAKSTLLGIMARESAYTGKTLTWDQILNSQQNLSPSGYTWDARPPASPVAVPGVTAFV